MSQIVLVRHSQTEWSRENRLTGLTDTPLTDEGWDQAAALAEPLARFEPVQVLTSPLRRAVQTAELAGLDAVVDDRLVEWDYGAYEGMTTEEVRAQRGDRWTVFTDGVVPGQTPGESLDQVASRTTGVLDDVAPMLEYGTVVIVAHANLLRVLATRWLGFPTWTGAQLPLNAGSISRIGYENGVPAIGCWNRVS
jgi:broad specificity phosphatase PhoE